MQLEQFDEEDEDEEELPIPRPRSIPEPPPAKPNLMGKAIVISFEKAKKIKEPQTNEVSKKTKMLPAASSAAKKAKIRFKYLPYLDNNFNRNFSSLVLILITLFILLVGC